MSLSLKIVLAATLLTLLIKSSATVFTLVAHPYVKTCFSDMFPDNESIAIKYEVDTNLVLEPNDKKVSSLESDVNKVAKAVHHYVYDQKGNRIGHTKSSSQDILAHTTFQKDKLTICAENTSKYTLLIHYNITVGVSNNDHDRVPDKGHLKQYQEDLERLEDLTDLMATDNGMALDKTRSRYFSSDNLPSTASKFAAIALAFIIILKVLQIMYLRHRLRMKKIL